MLRSLSLCAISTVWQGCSGIVVLSLLDLNALLSIRRWALRLRWHVTLRRCWSICGAALMLWLATAAGATCATRRSLRLLSLLLLCLLLCQLPLLLLLLPVWLRLRQLLIACVPLTVSVRLSSRVCGRLLLRRRCRRVCRRRWAMLREGGRNQVVSALLGARTSALDP